MKFNRRLVVLLTVALLVGLTAFVRHGRKEPVYQGKSLSEWLRAYRPIGATTPGSPQAADAVRHIGTNALPLLVRWIEEYQKPLPWTAGLLSYARKPGSPEILLETFGRSEVRAVRASWGFEILGEAARPAIPDLVRVANQGNPGNLPVATAALAYLGKDGLVPLVGLMTNNAFPIRYQAKVSACGMQFLGTNAHTGVVQLIHQLNDPNLATSAAELLGWLNTESEITVPALAECTHSSKQDLRMVAAFGLMIFGTSARPAVPDLLKMLNDPSLDIRRYATNSLQRIAPEALQTTNVLDRGHGG